MAPTVTLMDLRIPNIINERRFVLRHSLYNMLGLGLPLVAALFSIPILLATIGAEKFGILTLIWAIVSYFGIFDLGLGKAVTQQVSLAFSDHKLERLNPIVGTSSVLLLALGLLGAAALFVSAPFLSEKLATRTSSEEVTGALYWMSLAMPAIVLTSGYRGILEGTFKFGLVNLIRLPMGIFTFVGPLLALAAGFDRLDAISAVLAIGRIVAAIVHGWLALNSVPHLHGHGNIKTSYIKPLLNFGGWLTLSNSIGPFIGYFDRFVIGFISGAHSVSYFVTPQEIATKISLVPMAVSSAIFPTFASFRNKNIRSIQHSLYTYTIYIGSICAIPCIIISLFSYKIMSIWISSDFASNSHTFLQVFCIGVFINSLAHAPLNYLIYNNQSKTVSYFYLFQILPYLTALIICTHIFGLIGTAITWLVRIIIDTLLLNFLFMRYLKRNQIDV